MGVEGVGRTEVEVGAEMRVGGVTAEEEEEGWEEVGIHGERIFWLKVGTASFPPRLPVAFLPPPPPPPPPPFLLSFLSSASPSSISMETWVSWLQVLPTPLLLLQVLPTPLLLLLLLQLLSQFNSGGRGWPRVEWGASFFKGL